MTGAVVAVLVLALVGGGTAWYLLSIRGRATSVGSDVDQFRASLDALAPQQWEHPGPPDDTMSETDTAG